jgi:thioredoxin reductase (NADPH)
MAVPAIPTLSTSQMETLAALGEELTANVGDVLYRVGDRAYPFIAIREGEVAILDAAGNEIVRHGASSFLGELNLLSGQTVFVTAGRDEAAALRRGRPRRVARIALRGRTPQRPRPLDVHRSTRGAPARPGDRPRGRRAALVGSHDADAGLRPREPAPVQLEDAQPLGGAEPPLVRLPGGTELQHPSRGEVLRALGVGRELAPREEVDLLVVGAGPAGLAAAVYGARGARHADRREHRARRAGGSSRRIENYLGFPAGISGTELTSRAVSQARKFGARPATPYRAIALEPRQRTTPRTTRRGARDRRTRRRARHRRRLPAAPLDDLADYEG